MKVSEIKKLEVFTLDNAERKDVNFSVSLVYRGNFNDDRLIDSKKVIFAEIENKPLVWFDVYLGKKKDNKVDDDFFELIDSMYKERIDE